MSPSVKGLLAVIFMAGLLYAGWMKYADFLSRGQKPPASNQILNEMEASGVPDFSMTDLGGQSFSLSQFRGKIVILNFWASWCEPCIEEFPSMLKLVDEMKGDVILLAISADYEKEDIAPFLEAFNVTSPDVFVAWDKDQKLAKKFGTFKLPESYLIGRKGELIRKISGIENWFSPEALAFFRSH